MSNTGAVQSQHSKYPSWILLNDASEGQAFSGTWGADSANQNAKSFAEMLKSTATFAAKEPGMRALLQDIRRYRGVWPKVNHGGEKGNR